MPKNYSSVIEEIKSRCDIVDVISSVVPLKRAGANHKGCCPFHNEKTPSFIVSESKQIFTCFGCGASGDVIEFTKRYYNLGFQEAVERLALQYGIVISSDYDSKGSEKEVYYDINRKAARFFYEAIKKPGNPGLEYMIKRRFKPETIQKFGIGWADDEWQSLHDSLRQQHVPDDKALEISLLSKNDKGKIYDRFRGRVIFPIINTRGKVIGFGGRIIAEGEPKYLNSSESDIFQKKYNLFGLNLSRKAIQESGYAIMVEGYMDAASLYQSGIHNVCASCGTALTEEQAKLLKRYTNKVVLCYDADAAGIKAAIRGVDILRNAGLDARVLHVDDGKDPDEYLRKHTADDFRRLIDEKSIPAVDYKILLIQKKYRLNNTADSVKFLQELAGLLRSLSPVEADLYIQKVSRKYNISEGALRREVEGKASQPSKITVSKDENMHPSAKASARQILLEKTMIRLSLLHAPNFAKLKEYDDGFVTAPGLKIYSVLSSMYREDTEFDIDKLKEQLDEEELSYLNNLMEDVRIGSKESLALDDCVDKLKKIRIEKRKKEIKDILELAGGDENRQIQENLLKEYMELQKQS